MSVTTEEAVEGVEGMRITDEWQDDEYSRQRLQGVKRGDDDVTDSPRDDKDSFYSRPVPKVCRTNIDLDNS